MTSLDIGQFLIPLRLPIATRFITKALVLLSKNIWAPPPLERDAYDVIYEWPLFIFRKDEEDRNVLHLNVTVMKWQV